MSFSNKKGQYEASTECVKRVAAWLEDRKVPSLRPSQVGEQTFN